MLERGLLLRLDGPCVRTLQVNVNDAMKEIQIMTSTWSEFPWLPNGVDGKFGSRAAKTLERARHCGDSARPQVRMVTGFQARAGTRVAFNQSTSGEVRIWPETTSHTDHAAIGV
jgi:hypothetical protein